MEKFDGGDAHRYAALADHEDSSGFGFGGGGHDVLDGVAHDVEWCIGHGVFDCGWVLAEYVPIGGPLQALGRTRYADFDSMVRIISLA